MFSANYHTHAKYDDGYGELEEYVLACRNSGLTRLGFSCHAPLPFDTDWTMDPRDLPVYLKDAFFTQKKYSSQVEILVGLEVDFIPGIISPTDSFIRGLNLDYTIGSVHFLGKLDNGTHWTVDGSFDELKEGLEETFDNDIKKAVKYYYRRLNTMASRHTPTIIGHFDLIKKNNRNDSLFSENEDWYREAVMESLSVIADGRSVIEVNTGGISRKLTEDLYPSRWIITKCFELDMPLVVNSDAHKSSQLTAYFSETYEILKKIGYRSYYILTRSGWVKENMA